ncbi:MAG: NAD(+) synthase [Anaerolineales bacterium]|nr:NAD(+) synthase [Anaerolineales bacterium]
MDWPENPLRIDPDQTLSEIVDLIHNKFNQLNRRVAVIGLSGGLDSSLTASLALKTLGADRVKLYYLPERDSKPIHRKHAILFADQLNTSLKIISIIPTLRALRIYSLLPLSFFPGKVLKARAVDFGRKKFLEHSRGEFLSIRLNGSGGSWVSRGNAYVCAKHRVRSVILYREAERLNGMVIGAANKTEWMTGTFTQWGCDHSADVMPLLHLYRSQLEVLARHLNLPEEIRTKKADPDILPGLNDKGELLGSFEKADQILWGLENQIDLPDLEKRFGAEKVSYIQTLVRNSAHYRETPYSLL